jgi:RNA polymerase sigma-70 factor (ECF subfamily)
MIAMMGIAIANTAMKLSELIPNIVEPPLLDCDKIRAARRTAPPSASGLVSLPWTGRTGRAVSGNPVPARFTILKPLPPEARSNPLVRTVSDSAETPAYERSEENAWIERARAGDAEAYRRLVERYSEVAYGLALRMLGSPSDAEEVAQDGFLRAWRALPRFRGDSSFSTWLHRIVVRRALDRSATLKARRARETGLDAAAEAEAPGPGGASERGLGRRIDRLLASLSDVQRAAVVLYYYEDSSIEQVAQALGIPVGTVKTHLYRARGLLRAGWIEEDRRKVRE